jgi:hypothetical protein
VLEVVRENAFTASPYPVVLSLEVHCGVKQQDRMAELIISKFQDKLLTERVDFCSPESLKHKILIKGRPVSPESQSEEEEEEEELAPENQKVKPKETKISPSLAKLVVYQQSKAIKHLSQANEAQEHHVSSFSETKAAKLLEQGFEQFMKLTERAFTRIYPHGGRVDSSNLDPVRYWRAGCQMVALNYQTFDKPMRINRGFFLQNNNCGYILKPSFNFNQSWTISVAIISGYMLPKPRNQTKGEIVDPFVVTTLISPSLEPNSESIEEKFKTCVIEDNGFNPIWNNIDNLKILTFNQKVCIPELSFLSFTIMDKDLLGQDFLANATVPVNCLNNGYRVVSLFDHAGQRLPFSNLYVYIEITKTVQ